MNVRPQTAASKRPKLVPRFSHSSGSNSRQQFRPQAAAVARRFAFRRDNVLQMMNVADDLRVMPVEQPPRSFGIMPGGGDQALLDFGQPGPGLRRRNY